MPEMTLKDWLGLTVLAALIGVIGSLIALYVKEFIANRSFEHWKALQSLEAVYDRYRRPICTAAEELSGRCYINAFRIEPWRIHIGVDYLSNSHIEDNKTAKVDSRFYRYKLLSDSYRLCCFFGWIELYRRDVGLMNVNKTEHGRRLEVCIKNIRSDVADGQRNYHQNWREWRDALIFREEQRAIAHRMISDAPAMGLIDFGTFCEIVAREIESKGADKWFLKAVEFFSNLSDDRDFRITRMKFLVLHLAELRELLQPGSVIEEHRKGNQSLRRDLENEMAEARQATPPRPGE